MEYQYSENLRAILEVGESPSKNLLRVLGSEHQGKKIGISPERLDPIKPILRKYIAGLINDLDASLVDINGDGKVGAADLIILRKLIAGFDVGLK